MARRGARAAADEIAGACLAVRLRALNRTVTNVYDAALRPLGLKASQLNVLVAIATQGEIQPLHLGRALHLDKSTLSRNVDKMKAKGWIESHQLEGRGQVLCLTAAGDALVLRALPRWRRAQANTMKLVGDEGADALRALHRNLPT